MKVNDEPKKCSRCDTKIDSQYAIEFTDIIGGYVIEVCEECYGIVQYAASPDSCGDKGMLKKIQDSVIDPPKRMKNA